VVAALIVALAACGGGGYTFDPLATNTGGNNAPGAPATHTGGGDSAPTAPATYTTGGTVSGLTGSGLVLQNNGGDDLAISDNGSFVFTAPIASGAKYAVTVKSQPGSPTQTCTVNSGNGAVTNANVGNVAVICSTNAYTIGGTVSGLTAGSILVLQNNGDNDELIISGNFDNQTSFSFAE